MSCHRIFNSALRALPALAVGLPVGWLWWRLIDNLRIEWAINPQYSYGWAVPVLCVYLLWRRWNFQTSRPPQGELTFTGAKHALFVRGGSGKGLPAGPVQAQARSRSPTRTILFFVLALAWLPTRLFEQANPEWRLISWALAVQVIGLTLLLFQYPGGCWRSNRLLFPLVFFLVSVPWPTFVEAPLVQWLSRTNAFVAAELLQLVDVWALPLGNVIEVGTGAIGLDDACSGISSLQAVLMVSLFFGEYYRREVGRRVGLCLLGLALAFGFNVARTCLLAWIAAKLGGAAVSNWHDPAGTLLLVLCFGCVWALARSKEPACREKDATACGHKEQPQKWTLIKTEPVGLRYGLALLVWFFTTEALTEAWYRAHERGLPVRITWSVNLPWYTPSFHQNRLLPQARRILRFDQCLSGSWETDDGIHCSAIFLRWDPGRTAAHLPGIHTPDNCLAAAGRPCLRRSQVPLRLYGLPLDFRAYLLTEPTGPFYVFYTLWRDRALTQGLAPAEVGVATRFKAVILGQRNYGQRSLEFVVWDAADQREAETILANELRKIIQVGPSMPLQPTHAVAPLDEHG